MSEIHGDAIASHRSAAAALGMSHQAFADWVRHPLWPFGNAPWPRETVPMMRTWAEQTLRRSSTTQAAASQSAEQRQLAREGLQIKRAVDIERLKLLRLDRLVQERALIDRTEVEHGRVARIVAVRTAFLALPERLAETLAMQPSHVIESVLDRELRQICDDFAGGAPAPAAGDSHALKEEFPTSDLPIAGL